MECGKGAFTTRPIGRWQEKTFLFVCYYFYQKNEIALWTGKVAEAIGEESYRHQELHVPGPVAAGKSSEKPKTSVGGQQEGCRVA